MSATRASHRLVLTSMAAVSATALAWYWLHRKQRIDDYTSEPLTTIEALSKQELLQRFPCLQAAMDKSPMIGLYFSAAWCPDCQQATPSVRRIVQSDANEDGCLTVVYISSDTSAEQLQDTKLVCFDHVDFANVAERTGLKRHFGACAQKELRALNMTAAQRKHGIPTLILLESATGRVLTEKGVDHCLQQGASAEQVLDGWKRMLGDASATGDDSFDGGSMMNDLLNASKSNLGGSDSI